ncbi:MAG: 2-hydroxyacyl-CoA dehydratase [Ruminococcus sp.]|uniref:2-hydroxyacyl-CoA dehydratase family protein n=1 Tax=Ruminococcus sp. TaxID=41978 RepID=UPI0025E4DEE0|nr:2-hydroxyacyl-CoA dehydratase family protein [Ruminococcus sp.]MBR5683427.1 2-hydroxyacyl-CoA dehydratase [Ruminococcus sp.]
MIRKNDRTGVYAGEYSDTLNSIMSHQEKYLPEIKYFLDTEYTWSSSKTKSQQRPSVVILGTGIPEELVMAAGTEPYWLIGGSLGSAAWSDELVPRDTDPVSRSILGYIHQPDGADFSESLFIIPITSDSMRKIAYQLKAEGRKICLVDVPPDRSDDRAKEKWQRQMMDMVETISAHTRKRIKKDNIEAAALRVSKARCALSTFLNVSRGRSDIICDDARLLVQDSYYRTANLDEWTYHVQLLTANVTDMASRYVNAGNNRPNVVIMGSPIAFPNYKIPFLVHDVGLTLLDTIDCSALKHEVLHERNSLSGSCESMIRNIASLWYDRDASSAFVRNNALFEYISRLVRNRDIEGVVYHVLKGQIEYDFELERFEALFSKYNIPVFRLETDYQYQDVEQLRIRLEAFSEMLTQNRYKEVRKAK